MLTVFVFGAGTLCSQLRALGQTIPATYFGMHIHNAGTKTPWPTVPIPAWRLWDAHVTWADLEPAKDRWNFDGLDNYVRMAQEHDTEILLTFGYTPPWASARPAERSASKPGFAAEPKDMDDWRTFIRTVASRYKGRIHAYEIWNEPNLRLFWTGNIEQMVAMTRTASEIIHEVDPRAMVVSPSATTTAGASWLSEFLKMGGGTYVDVIGYHFYVYPEPPESMMKLIQTVRRIMTDNGVGGKPLWDTETGWSTPKPFPSDDLAAAYLARAYVLTWSAGVQRLYWYAWDNHGWVSLETTETDNHTLRSAGRAYQVMETWIIGARMSECTQEEDLTWICGLSRSGIRQWIVWNAAQLKRFAVPASWHADSFVPLLGAPEAVNGSSLEVGQLPILITASRQ